MEGTHRRHGEGGPRREHTGGAGCRTGGRTGGCTGGMHGGRTGDARGTHGAKMAQTKGINRKNGSNKRDK
jgi:hypothetical protein